MSNDPKPMSNGPKVGFSGTRKGMSPKQHAATTSLVWSLRPSEVHHGDCIGADASIHDFVLDLMLACTRVIVHPPSNPAFRAMCQGANEVWEAKPYHDRNRDIVDATSLLIAAPGADSRGTWNAITWARNRRKPVLWVDHEGIVHVG